MKRTLLTLIGLTAAAVALIPLFSCKHRDSDTILETRDGELYLRCMKCGRRSPGWIPGVPRYRRTA